MKMKTLAILLGLLIIITSCSKSDPPSVPPVITIGGVEITIGESQLYDLTSQGFQVSFYPEDYFNGELPSKCLLKEVIQTYKNNTRYPFLWLYNASEESKSFEHCEVQDVSIRANTEYAKGWAEDVLVNGVNFIGKDPTYVKEAMSKYNFWSKEEQYRLYYVDGVYEYTFSFNKNNQVDMIDVGINFIDLIVNQSFDTYSPFDTEETK